jgi:hypothetical protein
MYFLARILLITAILVGIGYAALYAVATYIEPEQRDIVIEIPMPRPKS